MADMTFRQALNLGRPLLLDGAMGTMLQASGLPVGMSPEQYCMESPQVLRGIHKAYLDAGADLLTTCTFGGNPFKLPKNLDVFAFNRRMAEVAREAARDAGRPVFVAGNVGPSGQFAKPLGPVEPRDLIAAFAAQIRGLVAGGADLIFVETQFDLAEARAAVVAARQECDLPVMVSMTFEQGVSLTGSSPAIFAETMQNLGVDVVGTNCSLGPDQMLPVLRELLSACACPVMAEPNAGLPELRGNVTVFPLGPEEFARKTAAFAGLGARILGGCCGTTPQHLAALSRTLRGMECALPETPRRDGICLTSRSQLVRIGVDEPLVVIGERINPTGKKALTQELQEGRFDTALQLADQQVEAGAGVLDVNVGASLVDETVLLPDLVQRLAGRLTLPLSLDSSNAEAIAKALPYCPGSFLVNSISGEADRMDVLGPLCRDYGAPFILLPLQGAKLPVRAAERIRIVEHLLERAAALGIPRRLVMVDILALAVSSKAEGGRQCLQMARWCRSQGLPTTLGLSNISFGLPARELLNATFLSMAVGAGLTSCIANPSATRLREAVDAMRVLGAHDPHAESFIASYAEWKPAGGAVLRRNGGGGAAKTLGEAVLNGDKENVLPLLDAELEAGADPFVLVQDTLIPAITEVGARYERREYFLPQLIRAAETMQTAFAHLKPRLEANRGQKERPVIVMATVEGDIHDIGKNIVALLLGNHGFDVVDAGKDVPAEAIVACALEHNARIIGLSALMTTTMVRMEDTIRLIRERDLPIKVMVGGAAVTQAFADAIGADAYCPDAVCAVRAAKNFV
ncbi:methionine synthase [Desulfovibrio sp. PG-178-WT-4]|uniref:Methionine synthase n=2 Tax=Desulfovibrio porci TaxID=2605782 RepID=A0A6L5XH22_9BACT|nr:homocysteine S-methyltransferase family protein [Desulfovibrio porci]MDY3810569.1 homocysteine S-methyltransferase family protein [Desulfovibrio porci]MSS26503.1 methionine synthase [Desulfovibrio porci]